jgi:hypothetical protein
MHWQTLATVRHTSHWQSFQSLVGHNSRSFSSRSDRGNVFGIAGVLHCYLPGSRSRACTGSVTVGWPLRQDTKGQKFYLLVCLAQTCHVAQQQSGNNTDKGCLPLPSTRQNYDGRRGLAAVTYFYCHSHWDTKWSTALKSVAVLPEQGNPSRTRTLDVGKVHCWVLIDHLSFLNWVLITFTFEIIMLQRGLSSTAHTLFLRSLLFLLEFTAWKSAKVSCCWNTCPWPLLFFWPMANPFETQSALAFDREQCWLTLSTQEVDPPTLDLALVELVGEKRRTAWDTLYGELDVGELDNLQHITSPSAPAARSRAHSLASFPAGQQDSAPPAASRTSACSGTAQAVAEPRCD